MNITANYYWLIVIQLLPATIICFFTEHKIVNFVLILVGSLSGIVVNKVINRSLRDSSDDITALDKLSINTASDEHEIRSIARSYCVLFSGIYLFLMFFRIRSSLVASMLCVALIFPYHVIIKGILVLIMSSLIVVILLGENDVALIFEEYSSDDTGQID